MEFDLATMWFALHRRPKQTKMREDIVYLYVFWTKMGSYYMYAAVTPRVPSLNWSHMYFLCILYLLEYKTRIFPRLLQKWGGFAL